MIEKHCVTCGKPVEKYRDDYEVFEGMHWICFHLVWEHDTDPDEPCGCGCYLKTKGTA